MMALQVQREVLELFAFECGTPGRTHGGKPYTLEEEDERNYGSKTKV